jgi:hypothetical protein
MEDGAIKRWDVIPNPNAAITRGHSSKWDQLTQVVSEIVAAVHLANRSH